MDTKLHAAPASHPAPTMWHADEDDTLVCLDVHDETHDVRTFTFASRDGKRFAFDAGQYFLFDVDLEEGTESRCYSISSSPHRTTTFSVTVKRVPGGRVSNWLHDNLAPGRTLKGKGPLGHFLAPKTAAKLLLLSAGSGITPVMSILRDLADRAEPVDVVFLHAARTPVDFVFREELKCVAGRLKGLRLQFLPESTMGEPSWAGLTGRISADYMRLAVPDLAERTVMCCGPAPFMNAAREITAMLGVPSDRYLEESFDAAVIEEPEPVAREEAVTRVYRVEFSKQAKTIEVSEAQTVLSCAKKSAVRIPSSCANGVCGTCKSKLVSGAVDMNHNGGIRQREIDAGFFLPCCSKPLSDLVIDR